MYWQRKWLVATGSNAVYGQRYFDLHKWTMTAQVKNAPITGKNVDQCLTQYKPTIQLPTTILEVLATFKVQA